MKVKVLLRQIIPYMTRLKLKNYYYLSMEYLGFDNDIINYYKSVGLARANELTYEKLKHEVLSYIDSLKISDYEYKFSYSSNKPTLYSSVYACMILGLFNQLNDEGFNKKWVEYFNAFQSDKDGFYRDYNAYNSSYEEGVGWGASHLLGHLIIALIRLKGKPKYKFKFLERFYDEDFLKNWLNSLDWTKAWSASNAIMNYGTILQYSRDYLEDVRAAKSVSFIIDWLNTNVNPQTGLWHSYKLNSYEKIADATTAAYHIYTLYNYDDIEIPYLDNAIEFFLKTQNKYGGFNKHIRSGACEDIDAIEPIARYAKSNNAVDSFKDILNKALIWVMANQNDDGGFVFARKNSFCFGAQSELYSKPNESNIFATWFRTLSILYILSALGDEQVKMLKAPGYEIKL